MGAVIDPVQLVEPALAQGPVPGVVFGAGLPPGSKMLPVPKVPRVHRPGCRRRAVRKLLLHAALTGQSPLAAHGQGPPLHGALAVDDVHGAPRRAAAAAAAISQVASVAAAQRALLLTATVQSAVGTLGVLAVEAAQDALVWAVVVLLVVLVRVVAAAVVGEAWRRALPLQVARALVLGTVPPGVRRRRRCPPLGARRRRPHAVFEAQPLAQDVHAVQLLLSHLGDAVEALAAQRALLHHLPLEVPAHPLLGQVLPLVIRLQRGEGGQRSRRVVATVQLVGSHFKKIFSLEVCEYEERVAKF